MIDEKELVQEEVESTPALEGIQELQQEQTEQSEPEQKQEQIQIKSEDNVRQLRLAKQKAERERDELLKRLEAVERNQAPVKQQEEEDDSFSINPDDLAEGKHLLKVSKKITKLERNLEERISRYEQQAAALAAESQLRIQYPDLDKVINQENIALLKDEYPELAATINANPDLYSKSVAAYTMIKRLGIHQDAPVQENQQRYYQNATKPRASASVAPQKSDKPLDNAYGFSRGLTKEMKAQAERDLNDILGY